MTSAYQDRKSNRPTLQREYAALLNAYGRAQARCSQLIGEQAAYIQRLEAEAMCLRAAVILRDTALDWARADQAALVDVIPGLPKRVALARRVTQLMERVQSLMRERLAWQDRASLDRQAQQVPPNPPTRQAGQPQPLGGLRESARAVTAVALREKSVLCVGKDAMALMLTRKVVEMAGGRYLGHSVGHDDGGELDGAALEASLVAADLVICQTGCVSHGAYWRVRDHCSRTGKQCVLVDKPEALSTLRLEAEQDR